MSHKKKKTNKKFPRKTSILIIPYDMEYKLGFVLYSKFSHTTQDFIKYEREVNLNIKSTPSVMIFNTEFGRQICIPESIYH